ncbi:MAG: hypothetical protein R8G66_14720 [Cytophagales bacterium]|nr:hypothetical protein [Cytophagales bacterium]
MRTEFTLGAVAIVSLIFMLMTFHDAEYALGLSLTILSIIYFPLGFWHINGIGLSKVFKREAYREISPGHGFVTFVAGFILSLLSSGCMFKVLQLPGYGVLLYNGQIAALILFVLGLISYLVQKSVFKLKLLGRLMIWGLLAFALLRIPGWMIVSYAYRDHPEYVRAYMDAVEHPDDEELQRKAEMLRMEINEENDGETD